MMKTYTSYIWGKRYHESWFSFEIIPHYSLLKNNNWEQICE